LTVLWQSFHQATKLENCKKLPLELINMTSLPFVKGEKRGSHETPKISEWVCFSSLGLLRMEK